MVTERDVYNEFVELLDNLTLDEIEELRLRARAEEFPVAFVRALSTAKEKISWRQSQPQP